MSEWHETATKEQIQQLQCNCVPWGLMIGEPRRLMSLVPRNDRVLWRPRTGEWFLEGGGKLYDSCVYRLRSDWQRPVEKPWVDVEPSLDGRTGKWFVDIPNVGVKPLDTIMRFSCWLLTRFEWIDDDGMKYQWDARLGCDYCQVPEPERVGSVTYDRPRWLIKESDVPARPILVRFLKEVSHA